MVIGSRPQTPGQRNRRTRGGALAVEAALIMPVLIVLTFGLIEFGHYLYLQHMVKGAAQVGVREAIPAGVADDTAARAAITKMMDAAKISSGKYSVNFNPAVGSAAPGTLIEVTVQCTWSDVGIRVLGLIGSGKQLRGSAVMRKE